jgi:hypothetical protein
VLASLVVVSKGAVDKEDMGKKLSEADFPTAYHEICRSFLPRALCDLQGHAVLSTGMFGYAEKDEP